MTSHATHCCLQKSPRKGGYPNELFCHVLDWLTQVLLQQGALSKEGIDELIALAPGLRPGSAGNQASHTGALLHSSASTKGVHAVTGQQGDKSLKDQDSSVLDTLIRMADDHNESLREAAANCLAEVHRVAPATVVASVQASSLVPSQQRDLLAQLNAKEVAASDANASRRTSGPREPPFSFAIDVSSAAGSDGGSAMPTPSGLAAAHEPVAKFDSRRQSSAVPGAGPGPSASHAAQPAAPAPKRGGFKDGGGVSVDGELPPAAPIAINSERELRAELDAAVAELAQAPNTEWLPRMAAMQKVEGLLLGGAAEWDCFHEALKGLAQALSQQFKERRSSIARQTCHLIGVLAKCLGPRFEPYALMLLPTLFGVLVITVQVMAESADTGVRAILYHCQTGRVLQSVADVVCKEKNPKMRQCCAAYLRLMLEEWDASSWSRQLEGVESAIRAAAQDAGPETRAASRAAMAAYHNALPDRANAFLKRLDPGLQDKLSSGLGAASGAAKAASRPASSLSRQTSLSAALAAKKQALARQASMPAQAAGGDEGIIIVLPGAKPNRSRFGEQSDAAPDAAEAMPAPRTRAPSGRVSNAYAAPPLSGGSSSGGGADADGAPSRGSAGGAPARSSRKSIGLPPGRIPGGSTDLTSLLDTADPSTQARAAAARRPRMSAAFDLPQRVPAAAPPAATPSTHAMRMPTEPPRAPLHPTHGHGAHAGAEAGGAAGRAPAPQPQGAASAARPTASWLERLAAPNPAPGAGQTAAAAAAAVDPASGGAAPPPAASVGPGLVPLPRVVAALLGGPRNWSDKVEALSALALHVRASAPPGSCSQPGPALDGPTASLAADPERMGAALERVKERLLEALEDPHAKVMGAVLPLLVDCVRHYGRVLEGQLDRLLPLLFKLGAEQKEGLRATCGDVLAECGRCYRPEVLLPVLSKCLDSVKVPRAKQAVLEFARQHVLVPPHGGAQQHAPVSTAHLKSWLVRLAPLLEDKSAELRRRAVEVMEVLGAAPWAREPVAYVAYQHNSADVAPLRRYLLASQPPAAPPAAPVPAGVTTSTTTSTLFSDPHTAARQSQPHMSVAGLPPPATQDTRPPLPSGLVPTYPGAGPTLMLGAPGVTVRQPHADGAAQLGGRSTGGGAAAAGQRPQPAGQESWGGAAAAASERPPAAQAAGYRGTASDPGSTQAAAITPPAAASRPAAITSPGTAAGAATTPSAATPRRPLQIPRDASTQLTLLTKLMGAARGALNTTSSTPPAAAALMGVAPGGVGQAQVDAMSDLMDAAAQCGREAWMRTFPLLMVDLGCWARHPSRAVRSMSYALLQELLARQPQLFTDANLESQLGLLLQGCADTNVETARTASSTLRALLGYCSAHKAMLLLQQALPRERDTHRRTQPVLPPAPPGQRPPEAPVGLRGERLVAVMDGVRQLAPRLERGELHALAFSPHPVTGSTLLEGLVSNLGDREMGVRKSAVMALAELWYRLGHAVRDVLQVLALSSFHLLSLYFLKLHGVTVLQPGESPTEHALVKGGGAEEQEQGRGCPDGDGFAAVAGLSGWRGAY